MTTNAARLRGALILTHNRPELLAQCIEAIKPQVDNVLVVDNASSPRAITPEDVALLHIPEQPPNIGKFWNMGFDLLSTWFDAQAHDVAVLCDDALVPEGWFAAVTQAMRDTGAAAGCSNPFGYIHGPRIKTAPDNDISSRMPGHAWISDRTKGIRADERLKWWWVDTSADWLARANGGMVTIGGYLVPNQRPNEYTYSIPAQREQSGRDGETFAEIYGYRPW